MKSIRVLVVDGHYLIRAGIRAVLDNHGEIEVVAETHDRSETLALVEKHQPDVLLLDLALPDAAAVQVVDRVRERHPDVRVIVLSTHTGAQQLQRTVRTGVAGYLVKDADLELATAVKMVAAGGRYFSPSLASLSADDLQRQIAEATAVEILTPRQRQILQLIASGHSTKEIAEKLAISVKTAETHRTELMNRLDIHDVAGLVRYAIRVGLATPEA